MYINLIPQPSLRRGQVAIPLWIARQLGWGEHRRTTSVHGDDFVLFVEEFHVAGLPDTRGGGFDAEEDEAAVAVDVEFDRGFGSVSVRDVFGVGIRRGHGGCDSTRGGKLEAMGDCGLHFADGATGRGVEFDERAAFAVHDEDAIGFTSFGNRDKVVYVLGAAPG